MDVNVYIYINVNIHIFKYEHLLSFVSAAIRNYMTFSIKIEQITNNRKRKICWMGQTGQLIGWFLMFLEIYQYSSDLRVALIMHIYMDILYERIKTKTSIFNKFKTQINQVWLQWGVNMIDSDKNERKKVSNREKRFEIWKMFYIKKLLS